MDKGPGSAPGSARLPDLAEKNSGIKHGRRLSNQVEEKT